MMTLRSLGLAVALGAIGCASNPVRPSCGGWRLALANAGTFGMYGLACQAETAQYLDVERCVAAGGDPAPSRRLRPSRPLPRRRPRDRGSIAAPPVRHHPTEILSISGTSK